MHGNKSKRLVQEVGGASSLLGYYTQEHFAGLSGRDENKTHVKQSQIFF